jgi:hypothetical protein
VFTPSTEAIISPVKDKDIKRTVGTKSKFQIFLYTLFGKVSVKIRNKIGIRPAGTKVALVHSNVFDTTTSASRLNRVHKATLRITPESARLFALLLFRVKTMAAKMMFASITITVSRTSVI